QRPTPSRTRRTVPTPSPPPQFSRNHPPTPDIYTLSLHDALPISPRRRVPGRVPHRPGARGGCRGRRRAREDEPRRTSGLAERLRSEEHTSELQSREKLVCRLLLEKKKTKFESEQFRTITTRTHRL